MKMPWRRERLPTPVFWPGEFHGLYNPLYRKDMTERLSLSWKRKVNLRTTPTFFFLLRQISRTLHFFSLSLHLYEQKNKEFTQDTWCFSISSSKSLPYIDWKHLHLKAHLFSLTKAWVGKRVIKRWHSGRPLPVQLGLKQLPQAYCSVLELSLSFVF